MRVEPAHVDQIRRARDGRMVAISADTAGVAADLRQIDPGLMVRFAENAECWIVYYAHCHQHAQHDTACADCREAGDREHGDLVLTVQARQAKTGVWQGLDQRVVDRIREIDARGRTGYDFAAEVEKQNERARERNRERFREQVGATGELAAHAVRKDLGSRYKGRAFIPR